MSYNDSVDSLRTKISSNPSPESSTSLAFVTETFQGWNTVEIFTLRELLWSLMKARADEQINSKNVVFRGSQLKGVEHQMCEICGGHLYGHLWAEIDENGSVVKCSFKENQQ